MEAGRQARRMYLSGGWDWTAESSRGSCTRIHTVKETFPYDCYLIITRCMNFVIATLKLIDNSENPY